MKTRLYEIKDSQGQVVESGTLGWWNSTIVMSGLAPHPQEGVSGEVCAKGGWCRIGRWGEPQEANVLRCGAGEWAARLAAKLGVAPMAVVDGIARVLEDLEDERLAPPQPLPPQPVEPPEGE